MNIESTKRKTLTSSYDGKAKFKEKSGQVRTESKLVRTVDGDDTGIPFLLTKPYQNNLITWKPHYLSSCRDMLLARDSLAMQSITPSSMLSSSTPSTLFYSLSFTWDHTKPVIAKSPKNAEKSLLFLFSEVGDLYSRFLRNPDTQKHQMCDRKLFVNLLRSREKAPKQCAIFLSCRCEQILLVL